MSFFPIVAFCTAMSAGTGAPIPPHECVWVEDAQAVETETACIIRSTIIKDDPLVTQNAKEELFFVTDGYTGKVHWYTFCVEEFDLRNFYLHFGVTDLADIPEET